MSSERDERLRHLRETGDSWITVEDPAAVAAAKIEVAFLMVVADGEIGAAEFDQFVDTVGMITAQRVERDRIVIVVRDLMELLATDGWEARLRSVAQVITDPGSRRATYRMAAGVAFADGSVDDAEARLFGLLAQAFEIPLDEASDLLTEVRNVMYGVAPEDDPAAIPLTVRRR